MMNIISPNENTSMGPSNEDFVRRDPLAMAATLPCSRVNSVTTWEVSE